MKGKVYLVGAGPGDPELLTLKALRVLATAHVVLHDDLVPHEIVNLVSPAACVLNVGKRFGSKRISQQEINALMVDYASAGLTVIRLKAGDPMIFGRVEEEIAALRDAEINLEIVPGITAALGAAAAVHVPLTQRGVAPAVCLVTYSRAPGQVRVNWRSIADSQATMVIYMPGSEYDAIAEELCGAGFAKETPCVIVSRASRSDERRFATKLGQLPLLSAMPAPALLIIGSVANGAVLDSLKDVQLKPGVFPAEEVDRPTRVLLREREISGFEPDPDWDKAGQISDRGYRKMCRKVFLNGSAVASR